MKQNQIGRIIFILLMIIVLASCNTRSVMQTTSKGEFVGYNQAFDTLNNRCFDLHVKLITLQDTADTILSVRRYLGSDSTKLVVCNSTFGDQKCEDIVWNNKTVTGMVNSFKRLKDVAVIDFHQISDTNLVCNLYLYDRHENMLLIWRSFQLYKYRIVTISGLMSNDFYPIENYGDDDGKTEP